MKSATGRDRRATGKSELCRARCWCEHLFLRARYAIPRYLYHYVLWNNDGPIIVLSIIVQLCSQHREQILRRRGVDGREVSACEVELWL